ncbi:hypothetical protein [Novosphingobium arvoryzae]|uniref:PEP-CTERM protein-sorting domain-containing protein n=1 Tax=Novosphingobium arvoryzae TaxID=1256514 RepID=A0A918VK95_9SPHN|nr:hypothetical protein [Novosphingobium arvoryzae]GHA03173.1 hypothetical protein GCM10011617_25180 [Novosphingobium arvoryzae]
MKDKFEGRSPIPVLAITAVALCAAGPALASSGASIPDPSNLALFAIGVLGLIIGRQGSRNPPSD